MRLFIAVQFTEEIKDGLCAVIEALKANAGGGNFTARQNLHLTLAFLGEVKQEKVPSIQRIMDSIPVQPFLLQLGNTGTFRRSGGDIYWIGVKPEPSLLQMQSFLTRELRKNGYPIEQRAYRPHVTLGREVIAGCPVDTGTMQMQVNAASLMKSGRIKGKLTYTELYRSSLSI